MTLAADALLPKRSPRTVAGERVEWTLRDVVYGILLFVALVFGTQVLLLPFFVGFGEESDELYGAAFVLGAALEVGIAVVAARFTFAKYGGGFERLGLRRLRWSTLGWAALALVAAYALSAVYGVIINVLDVDWLRSECAEQIPDGVRDSRVLMALAAIVVIAFAPPCEELFFRGFVFTGLAGRWGIVAGVLVSGLLFAAVHLSYKAFVPIALVGIVFAMTYWRSGNLLSTMLAHVVFNSISIAAIAGGGCD